MRDEMQGKPRNAGLAPRISGLTMHFARMAPSTGLGQKDAGLRRSLVK
jgi:hypothetical protein